MRASFVLARVALCWLWLGLSLGCANKRQTAERASASAAASPADLPEPPSLVAELSLARPEASYRALRELGRPLSTMLPVGFPMFAATALGLPPLSADSFDPDITAVGSLAQSSKGQLGWVVALHAVSGPELVAKLSTGDHAPFRALPGNQPGLTLLQPTVAEAGAGSSAKAALPLGVFDNYLLAAADAELLASVGPYTARMLPRRSPSHSALTVRLSQHALATVVVPGLRAFWASYRTTLANRDQADRAAHGGRVPDFGDPAQVILSLDSGVESALSLIEGATALELDLDPFSNRLELTLLLTPGVGSPGQTLLAALGGGDASALLTLPRETLIAFGSSRSAVDREAAAKTAGNDWARLLGPRLSQRDAQSVHDALSDWELGRGAHTSYGLLGGADPGAFVVADVADAARLKHAAHGLFGLLALGSVRAPMTEFLGQPRVTESVAQHTDFASDVQLAKLSFASVAPANHPKFSATTPLSCAWFVEDKTGFAAAGKDATLPLKKVVLAARGNGATLGANPGVAEGVERLGDQAALFAYADARLALPGPASDSPAAPAPLFLACGKRNDTGFVRLELTKAAVDLLLGRAVGL